MESDREAAWQKMKRQMDRGETRKKDGKVITLDQRHAAGYAASVAVSQRKTLSKLKDWKKALESVLQNGSAAIEEGEDSKLCERERQWKRCKR